MRALRFYALCVILSLLLGSLPDLPGQPAVRTPARPAPAEACARCCCGPGPCHCGHAVDKGAGRTLCANCTPALLVAHARLEALRPPAGARVSPMLPQRWAGPAPALNRAGGFPCPVWRPPASTSLV